MDIVETIRFLKDNNAEVNEIFVTLECLITNNIQERGIKVLKCRNPQDRLLLIDELNNFIESLSEIYVQVSEIIELPLDEKQTFIQAYKREVDDIIAFASKKAAKVAIVMCMSMHAMTKHQILKTIAKYKHDGLLLMLANRDLIRSYNSIKDFVDYLTTNTPHRDLNFALRAFEDLERYVAANR